jgi:hypothetical protein
MAVAVAGRDALERQAALQEARRLEAARRRTLRQFPGLVASASRGQMGCGGAEPVALVQRERPAERRAVACDGPMRYAGVPVELLRSGSAEIDALAQYRQEHLWRREHAPRAAARVGDTGARNPNSQKARDPSALRFLSSLERFRATMDKIAVAVRTRQLEEAEKKAKRLRRKRRERRLAAEAGMPAAGGHEDDLDETEEQEQEQEEEQRRRQRHQQQQQQQKSGARADPLRELFLRFDADGDGRVSRNEFSVLLLDRLGLELKDSEVSKIFEVFDPNGDGELCFAEFAFAYYNRRAFEQRLRAKEHEMKKARSHLKKPFIPCNPFDSRKLLVRSLSLNNISMSRREEDRSAALAVRIESLRT